LLHEAARFFTVFNADHLPWFATIARDGNYFPVNGNVPMSNQLTRRRDSGCHAQAKYRIVKAHFQQLEQYQPSGTFDPSGTAHIAEQLALGESIIKLELLLFLETQGIFGTLSTVLPMLSWGIFALGLFASKPWQFSQAAN
jgi:hypothetical protein